jgi:glycosyltransferase involved in cell wall biosynthesis
LTTGGGIDADAMPLHYNAADVVLQTSYSEASPTIVKEALACEIPVVSTDVGDTREVLTGVPYCRVCSESPHDLARAVLFAHGHRANGARQHLLSKGMSLGQVAQRLVAAYDQVLMGAHKRDRTSS